MPRTLSNDQLLLKTLVESQHIESGSSLDLDAFFSRFVAEQLLKDIDLSEDDLDNADVDGPNDGGIDHALLLVDGVYCVDNDDVPQIRDHADLEVILIQSKHQYGFGEEPLNRLNSSLGFLLDLGYDWKKDADKLRPRFNDDVFRFFERFRDMIRQNITKSPTLSFRLIYACMGDQRHDNLIHKVSEITRTVRRAFSDARCDIEFFGAAKLLETYRSSPTTRFTLPISQKIEVEDTAIVVITELKSLYEHLLRNEYGSLRENLFDANVRDYQGNTDINKAISETLLANRSNEEFWWLNNGITMLSSKTERMAYSITVENPQIVNGMQTSSEIFRYFDQHRDRITDDKRKILIKILTVPDDQGALRDRIIRATNSQNQISNISLRATDKIQRDIEDYLLEKGLYYDRRRNYYRNKRKARKDIVTMQFLAQAINSILNSQPHASRARPSSITQTEKGYREIFPAERRVELFYSCADFMRFIDARVNRVANATRAHRQNIRFFVAFAAGQSVIDGRRTDEERAAVLLARDFQDGELESIIAAVQEAFTEGTRLARFTEDRFAKNSEALHFVSRAVYPVATRFGRRGDIFKKLSGDLLQR